ncbi:hypothetical protein METBIDRAFT_104627 [Metschnikowia bicuspidata var. bicuspidata NRRL YB-4993]|uniref:Uncharacterized protein n=1 Tax=Metschnikowia bicuspidata var. bicuspidata NRRL YB-4993 TaxID=869754 RepID=A0A1A0HHP2_9ASCO|nr:hypothetical protein METBIDRAFT_104627 [Metschnikowia bicuspidata var. bicuspidata NRRL YB-4993]OBA23363.1 hypothetical protein METBIDRAFT_104627 [Metschnikowia bicuspidata var. bicuspidata NRRL YB-4993]
MADSTLVLARRQNESLEKSLQSLRGKLTGLRGVAPSRVSGCTNQLMGKENADLYEKNHAGGEVGETIIPRRNPLNRHRLDTSRSEAAIIKITRDKGQPHNTNRYRFGRHVVFENSSETDGNYFDDFRRNVQEIRKQEKSPIIEQSQSVAKSSESSSHLDKPQNPDRWKPGEAKQFLVSKIEHQTDCIEGLETKIQKLEMDNQELQESHSKMRAMLESSEQQRKIQEINHRQTLLDFAEKSKVQHTSNREDPSPRFINQNKEQIQAPAHSSLEALLEETKRENTQLRLRVREIAERAHLLNSIHDQRVKILESKLSASMSVAKYYCDHLELPWRDSIEDSTEEILFGLADHTTIDLLKEVPGFQTNRCSGKKRLRAYFLATLFTIRLRKQVESRRLWEPYLRPL